MKRAFEGLNWLAEGVITVSCKRKENPAIRDKRNNFIFLVKMFYYFKSEERQNNTPLVPIHVRIPSHIVVLVYSTYSICLQTKSHLFQYIVSYNSLLPFISTATVMFSSGPALIFCCKITRVNHFQTKLLIGYCC